MGLHHIQTFHYDHWYYLECIHHFLPLNNQINSQEYKEYTISLLPCITTFVTVRTNVKRFASGINIHLGLWVVIVCIKNNLN